MKTFKHICLLVLVISFISCSSTEDSPSEPVNVEAQMLVGTWKASEITQEGTASTPGVPVDGTITAFGKNIDATIVFTENPANFTASGGYTNVISVSIVGQAYTDEIDISISDFLNQGTWTVDKGTITLTQGGQQQAVIVTQINSNTLKLEFDVIEPVMLQGVPVTIDVTVKMSLTKQ